MSKHVLNALPELEKAGVINAETAEQIQSYYRQKESSGPEGRINLVFALIGTVLVSLGLILMVAHNWDNLAKPIKLFFSLLPLIIGQILCAFCLFKKNENRLWRESSATFLFFAVGASLALVSQTYHIPGSIKNLLFTWMVISFPLIYLMRSSLVSLLYLIGITVYAINDGYGSYGEKSYHYWWMISLIVPHYLSLIRRQPQSNFTYFHHWFLPISLTICLGTVAGSTGEWLFIGYMSLFASFYLLGISNLFHNERIVANGYIVMGSLGTMFILLLTSFKDFWRLGLLENNLEKLFKISPELIATVILTIIACILLMKHTRNRDGKPINFFGFVFLAFIWVFFIGLANPLTASIIVNLLVLAAAILTINRGHRLNHLGILNYGLLIITALVLCRFFDTDISFVIRGLMFIAVGAAFFIANNRLLKKRKQHAK